MAEYSIKNSLMMEEIKKLISEGKSVTIKVKGYSMSPFLVHERDNICLTGCKDGDIVPGAVVLVKDTRGVHLVHRIVERDGDMIVLEGDGNIKLQERAEVKEVIAIVKSIERFSGGRDEAKTYTTDSKKWKRYSKLWLAVKPIRRYLLAIWRRIFRSY